MDPLTRIHQLAQKLKKRIVFPEYHDSRILQAVVRLAETGGIQPILVCPANDVPNSIRSDSQITILDPQDSIFQKQFPFIFYELRKHKGMSFYEARKIINDPLIFGGLLLATGRADGMIAGATNSTANVLRAAVWTVRTRPGTTIISGSFLIVTPDHDFGDDGCMFFADCAVNPDPTARQLVDITRETAATAQALLGMNPRIAMLSFSTKGSARHPMVEKVRQATELVMGNLPGATIDGELQLDAALVPEVASAKAPNSKLGGNANILIFPDLNSGNIGYKLAQRLGRAKAIGPIIQGLARPVNDLSRGCTVQDIVDLAAITSCQAREPGDV